MTQELDNLLMRINDLVEELPPDAVHQLSNALMKAGGEDLRGRLHSLSVTDASKRLYKELDNAWVNLPDVSAETLGVAIESAWVSCECASEHTKVSIVWTGPATDAVPLRRTEQVLQQIIQGARKELLIVSFVAYKVDEIMTALKQALDRGVKVTIVIETEQESGGKLSFDQLSVMRERLPAARIYTWPLAKRLRDESGHYGVIHAKCAVADRQVSLVSSANLTGNALELNMELGLLVSSGNISGVIVDNFNELIQRQIIKEVSA